MNWQEVCEHPSLQNLPFKIELNQYGQIVMSPVKFDHSAFQGEIAFLLRSLRQHGKTLVECAIHTRKGTKVADVAWLSGERYKKNKHKTECDVAPEICVEVISASNTEAEMQEKRELYVETGAQEVWTCEENGEIHFYDAAKKLERSVLVPNFPRNIEI